MCYLGQYGMVRVGALFTVYELWLPADVCIQHTNHRIYHDTIHVSSIQSAIKNTYAIFLLYDCSFKCTCIIFLTGDVSLSKFAKHV